MSDFTPNVIKDKAVVSPKMSTGKKRVFHFYCDPAHSWMKVPRKLLAELGVEAKISTYSYQKGNFVYLEEDCDAGIVLDCLKAKGVIPVLKSSHTNKSSRIRSYPSYVKPSN